MNQALKRILFRLAALGLLVGLSSFLVWSGRGQTLLVDNKTIQIQGQELPALGLVQVSVNGKPPVEVARLERVKIEAMGTTLTLRAEIVGGMGVGKTVETSFTLTGRDMHLISLPALLAGLPEDQWISVFVPPTAPVSSGSQEEENPDATPIVPME